MNIVNNYYNLVQFNLFIGNQPFLLKTVSKCLYLHFFSVGLLLASLFASVVLGPKNCCLQLYLLLAVNIFLSETS